jgi:putative methionine-R-sulfoxide reductase with GAF domain
MFKAKFDRVRERGASAMDTQAVTASRSRAALSLAYLVYACIQIFIVQQGRVRLPEASLLPVALLMLLAAGVAEWWIRRDRCLPAIRVLYLSFVLVPPVAAVLVLKGLIVLALVYIVLLTVIFVSMLLPTLAERNITLVGILSILLCLAIEWWDPAFRAGSASVVMIWIAAGLAGLGLLALSIRQAVVGDILTKMIVSFVSVTVFSVAIIAFMAQRSLSSSLTATIGDHLANLSTARSAEIGLSVEREYRALKVLANSKNIQAAALAVGTNPLLSEADLARLDRQWQAADQAGNDQVPLVARVLNNPVSAALLEYRSQFPQHVEVFLTGLQGYTLASTNRTSDYIQSDEAWWQTAYANGGYIGLPEYDSSSKTIAINMAVPVRENGNSRIVGILRSTVNFNIFIKTLTAGLFGKTGRTNIVLPDRQELALAPNGSGSYDVIQQEVPAAFQSLGQTTLKYQRMEVDGIPKIAASAAVTMPGNAGEDAEIIFFLRWKVVTFQDEAEALLPVTLQTRNIVMLAVAIILAVALAAFFLARLLTSPIIHLNAAAEKVAAGDLTVEAPIESRDEIGALAGTFNSMTRQVRDLVGSLEQRVDERTRALADRTKALATSTEVSRRLSTILDRDRLVKEVVEQLVAAFGYYYAHIYLFDTSRQNLLMVGGTGGAGRMMLARGHSIPRGRGLVGRAAETNAVVLVPDVSREPGWLANELLPETRSEIAVPISLGAEVLGVFDVQHNVVNGLTDQDADLLQSIASQVAVALQNANAYKEAQRQAQQEAMVRDIGLRIQDASTVEDALKVAVRELGRALGTRTGVHLQRDGEKE